MKHVTAYILIMGLILNQTLQAQNNPFKIDDALYADYQRCNKVLNEDVVLAMADSLFHKATRKGDVKSSVWLYIIVKKATGPPFGHDFRAMLKYQKIKMLWKTINLLIHHNRFRHRHYLILSL